MSDKTYIEKGYVPPPPPSTGANPTQNGYVPPATPVIRQAPAPTPPAQTPTTSKGK
jgi:hypothetical protein